MNKADGAGKAIVRRQAPIALLRIGLLAVFGLASGIAGVLFGLAIFGTPSPPSVPAEETGTIAFVMGKFIRHAEPRPLPDLAFSDAGGKVHHLSEWRGKAVLMNLWATWCAPCKVEMASLDRLQAKAGSEHFTVLALSTDRGGLKEPSAFFAKERITHLALYNDNSSETTTRLKASGLPLTVLVDEQGREVARVLGPRDWDSAESLARIEELIGAPAKSG